MKAGNGSCTTGTDEELRIGFCYFVNDIVCDGSKLSITGAPSRTDLKQRCMMSSLICRWYTQRQSTMTGTLYERDSELFFTHVGETQVSHFSAGLCYSLGVCPSSSDLGHVRRIVCRPSSGMQMIPKARQRGCVQFCLAGCVA